MKCKNCGNELPSEVKVCPNCGKKVSDKKVLLIALIVVVVIAIIIVIACMFSTKTVTCTLTNDDSGYTLEQEVSATFKSDKVQSAEFKFKYTLEDEYVDYMDIIYESVEEGLNEYSEEEGVDITLSKDDNVINATMSLTREGLEAIGDVYLDDTDETSATFIEDMEEQGYTCK